MFSTPTSSFTTFRVQFECRFFCSFLFAVGCFYHTSISNSVLSMSMSWNMKAETKITLSLSVLIVQKVSKDRKRTELSVTWDEKGAKTLPILCQRLFLAFLLRVISPVCWITLHPRPPNDAHFTFFPAISLFFFRFKSWDNSEFWHLIEALATFLL